MPAKEIIFFFRCIELILCSSWAVVIQAEAIFFAKMPGKLYAWVCMAKTVLLYRHVEILHLALATCFKCNRNTYSVHQNMHNFFLHPTM